MSSDRAAVAREVAKEVLAELRRCCVTWEPTARVLGNVQAVEIINAVDALLGAAPPAPETVTVNLGTEILYLRDDELWIDGSCAIVAFPESRMSCALSRIASDARVIAARDARIAELEKAVQDQPRTLYDSMWQAIDRMGDAVGALTGPGSNCHVTAQRVCETLETLQSERDAALRALEEAKNRPCPCAVASKTLEDETSHGEEPECPAAATRLAATAPAPIPLGAVVEVDDVRYTNHWPSWHGSDGSRAGFGSNEGRIITALYHARHPVATRETALQMCKALWPYDKLEWHEWEGFARLRSAGFTLEGA